MLTHELQHLDVDCSVVNIAGQEYRRVLQCTATYTSGRARAVVPMEMHASIIGGHWTPLAARQANVLMAHLTPRGRGAAVLEELKPSVSNLDRLPTQVSACWEERGGVARRQRGAGGGGDRRAA